MQYIIAFCLLQNGRYRDAAPYRAATHKRLPPPGEAVSGPARRLMRANLPASSR